MAASGALLAVVAGVRLMAATGALMTVGGGCTDGCWWVH